MEKSLKINSHLHISNGRRRRNLSNFKKRNERRLEERMIRSKRKRKWRNLPELIRINAFKEAEESKEMMVRREREK